VTPEGTDYLNKARDDLDDAKKIAALGLAKIDFWQEPTNTKKSRIMVSGMAPS
jgi:hypothetical protein